jgi:hypothetical protein
MPVLPFRHLLPDMRLHTIRYNLKERRSGAPTARTGGYLRHETPDFERLKDLLRYQYLLGAISARLRRQRNPDGIANSLLQQHR